jgi:hypothetical protein
MIADVEVRVTTVKPIGTGASRSSTLAQRPLVVLLSMAHRIVLTQDAARPELLRWLRNFVDTTQQLRLRDQVGSRFNDQQRVEEQAKSLTLNAAVMERDRGIFAVGEFPGQDDSSLAETKKDKHSYASSVPFDSKEPRVGNESDFPFARVQQCTLGKHKDHGRESERHCCPVQVGRRLSTFYCLYDPLTYPRVWHFARFEFFSHHNEVRALLVSIRTSILPRLIELREKNVGCALSRAIFTAAGWVGGKSVDRGPPTIPAYPFPGEHISVSTALQRCMVEWLDR